MKRESWTVGPESIRQATPGYCIHCRAKVGAEHEYGCEMRRRTVVIMSQSSTVVDVPEDWTVSQIEKHYRDWCASNWVNDLVDLVRRVPCICGITSFRYWKEADKKDEQVHQHFVDQLRS